MGLTGKKCPNEGVVVPKECSEKVDVFQMKCLRSLDRVLRIDIVKKNRDDRIRKGVGDKSGSQTTEMV